jgi:hypothetical protein
MDEIRTYGRNFWRQARERAVKTAAQAGVLALGADVANAIPGVVHRPGILLGAIGGGALLSLLTSIATAGTGPKDDPSMVRPSNP